MLVADSWSQQCLLSISLALKAGWLWVSKSRGSMVMVWIKGVMLDMLLSVATLLLFPFFVLYWSFLALLERWG